MYLKIINIYEFLNCVHDCVYDVFSIEPRNFVLVSEAELAAGRSALVYDPATDRLSEFPCSRFNKQLHVHDPSELGDNEADEGSRKRVFCSSVDALAAWYLDRSIFGNRRVEIISTLHDWLPSSAYNQVSVRIDKRQDRVNSYFEPSFCIKLFQLNDIKLVYNYFKSNIVSYIVYDEKSNVEIMVRARSRSRSRSPGARRRRPGRPRSRSRSRSRSPSQRYRRRSGSRSRSRSRSRS